MNGEQLQMKTGLLYPASSAPHELKPKEKELDVSSSHLNIPSYINSYIFYLIFKISVCNLLQN